MPEPWSAFAALVSRACLASTALNVSSLIVEVVQVSRATYLLYHVAARLVFAPLVQTSVRGVESWSAMFVLY